MISGSILLVVVSILDLSVCLLPQNCRTVVRSDATNPLACVSITRNQLDGGSLNLDVASWGTPFQISTDDSTDGTFHDLMQSWLNNPPTPVNPDNPNVGTSDAATALNPNALPGACRWDLERSNVLGSSQACLCPATETCALDRKGCYWYDMRESTDVLLKSRTPSFMCINTAERFYHLLANLLRKRGKKDFAIKIRYGATPARGELPMGPYGPAIIGGGSLNSMNNAMMQMQKKLGPMAIGAAYHANNLQSSMGIGQQPYGQGLSSYNPYGPPQPSYHQAYGPSPPHSPYGQPPAPTPQYGPQPPAPSYPQAS